MSVIPLKKAPDGPFTVMMITEAGAKLSAVIPNLARDMIYAGKLWALNDQISTAAKQPVYCQITASVIDEVRQNARSSWSIAERWAVQLQTLETAPTLS